MAAPDLLTLEVIERRALWLASRMIDYANHERVAPDRADRRIKVGGHQASSASVTSILTALYFGHLGPHDKVAVKPHASPVLHAINYLCGNLDRSYLTRLRQFGGLQAYPSRTKDPDVSDFSTGSVGLGVVAPLFASVTRRYVQAHFGEQERSRFVAVVGDAELDEGNVWEAVDDPITRGCGDVMLVVDLNRQSLDRVIPDMKGRKLIRLFEESGWHVEEIKYGNRLESAFARSGGDALRAHIDSMSNEQYQSLFALHGADLRNRFLADADPAVVSAVADVTNDQLGPLIKNLGGHDLGRLVEAYRNCDAVTDRPSIVFAYTIKGHGLPFAGDPLNHAAILTPAQIESLRTDLGLTADTEWDRFASDSPAGKLCAHIGEARRAADDAALTRPSAAAAPHQTSPLVSKPTSTQESFGRILTSLGNEPVAARMVTTSPDVSVSTNLGGWINKMGVFSPTEAPDFIGDDRLLRWKQGPSGRHLELGISEMNLFMLLGQLGLAHELHGQPLVPIGTVYDPFVCRGLDAFIYGTYNASRFIVAGTPAGITLSPEGGAHQSTITASIGLELPGVTYCEPAFAQALDWLMCDGINRLHDDDGEAMYLRLSTRPLDQYPFTLLIEQVGADVLRAQVIAGGYRLRTSDAPAALVIATCGAVVPEVLEAAAMLDDEGVATVVLDITSSDRLYRSWRASTQASTRTAQAGARHHPLMSLLDAAERRLPLVTVQDAASHHLAWLGSVFGAPTIPVGVDAFGQSGTIEELYRAFDLLPEQIVNAALVALDE
jgi:pyruvate dehydrogenase E1 component